uniref:hypothetical protein n=1 Tax=Endozoicomonas sp. ONNA1 TaxID=2828740 RepID=UPI0021484EF6
LPLNLSTASLVCQNWNWKGAFQPKAEGRQRMHDIGQIGKEISFTNDGEMGPIDTSSNTFDNAAFAQMMQAAVEPTPLISIDVEEGGPLTWLQAVLIRAANAATDPEAAREATESIIAAADNLTNGRYSSIAGQNNQIVYVDVQRIHNGRYPAENGTERSIADVDYLAVLSRNTGGDNTIIQKWHWSLYDQNAPEGARLVERENIIRAICPDAVFTGMSRRITFNTQFVYDFCTALMGEGIHMEVDTPQIDVRANNRADVNYANFSMGGGQNQFFGSGPMSSPYMNQSGMNAGPRF